MKELGTILEELEELEDIKLFDESKNDNEPALNQSEAMAMIATERKKLGQSCMKWCNTRKKAIKHLTK